MGCRGSNPKPFLYLQISDRPRPRARKHAPCCFSRLKKLPNKVLDDMDDDDDLSTDGGSLYEAPLSYTFSKDSTTASQI